MRDSYASDENTKNLYEFDQTSAIEDDLETPRNASYTLESEHINQDLMDENYENMFGSPMSRLPLMESMSANGMDDLFAVVQHSTIEVQASMATPYFYLEIFACMFTNFLIYANAFTFALIEVRSTEGEDFAIRYILYRVINISTLAVATYVFTNPDTYKSINITLEYLMINCIIFEYSFVTILKYITIHFFAAVVASFATLGIYNNLIKDIPTKILLANIFSSKRNYGLTYSFLLVAAIKHILMSIALTIITNKVSSLNARGRTLHKAFVVFLLSVTFGTVIGPVGYVWPNLVLYCAVICVRAQFDAFDTSLFIAYILTVSTILIFYPIIAIQIKFVWRNKYRRYIEYGL